jgi:hypothetical protein
MVDLHIDSDYNMVTIHRHEFEDLLANRIPLDTIVMEQGMKDAAGDAHPDFLKRLYETMHIVEHIDISASDGRIVVDHGYRDPDSINVIKEMLIRLLAAGGHTYKAYPATPEPKCAPILLKAVFERVYTESLFKNVAAPYKRAYHINPDQNE